jgi:DNA-binding transcriptional regulator YiaG
VGRHLDELLRRMAEEPARPRRKGEPHEEPEGLFKPPRRPSSRAAVNPLADPLAHIKRPLRPLNGPEPREAQLEFAPIDVLEIRYKFHATQRQFARMFGISVETLRNWEQGKRRPHGPARALLRVAKANPEEVVRTLWRYRRAWWLD